MISDLAEQREEKAKKPWAKSPDGSARGLLLLAKEKRNKENDLFLHDGKVGEVYD
jgi:hypothetical protein